MTIHLYHSITLLRRESLHLVLMLVFLFITLVDVSGAITSRGLHGSSSSTPMQNISHRASHTRTTSTKSITSNDSINLWNFRSISTWNPPTMSSNKMKSRTTRRGGRDDVLRLGPSNSAKLVRRKNKVDQGGSFYNDNNGMDRNISEYNDRPSVEEMRAQLGPIGLLVANAVEVGITTAGSYISGGLFGYLIGGTMAVPTLFRNSEMAKDITLQQAGQSNGFREIQRRIGSLNLKAASQAKSWAQLSAACSGFHALTRVCRGGKEDKWNVIVGSAFTGAYLSRNGGPQAMLQGASTYAGLTYLLDMFFGGSGYGEAPKSEWSDFQDQPLQTSEERGF